MKNLASANPFEYSDLSTGLSNSNRRFGRRSVLVIDEMSAADSAENDVGLSRPKLRLFGVLLFVMLGALIGRAFHLQIVQGVERLDQAENNRIRLERIPAMRGLIEDRTGRPLVRNVPNFIVTVTPNALPRSEAERRATLSRIAALLNKNPEDVAGQLAAPVSDNQPVSIAEQIDKPTALKIMTELEKMPGINLESDSIRDYASGEAFSHLLGYVGKVSEADLKENPSFSTLDLVGKTGLEAYYDDKLRGRNGYRKVERDHLNREKRIIASQPSAAGLTLTTTIDADLQAVLAESLNQVVNQLHATGGAAVALDPRDGSVLALVSSPGYDINAFTRGLSADQYRLLAEDARKPFLNRPIAGEYPSGSTIKPLIASAALQEGLITPQTTIMSQGGIKIDRWFFPDWKSGGHGLTNLKKALAESVNTYFYTIGGGQDDFEGLGIDRINEYARQFGLAQTLNVDLPGERAGFLPTKKWKEAAKDEPWYIGDTYHLSIGQGDLLVTPLQIANMTAIIANGGIYYQPHVAQAWRQSDGTVVEKYDASPVRKSFIKSGYLQAVRDGLREAVLSGSAQSLASLPVPVAGKTGTAEFGSGGKTHAWFTAFAPYDSPEIVIAAIVEGGGEGQAAALPVVRQGLQAYFK